MEHLQGGAWRGRGADAFYAEMKEFVLPSVGRLVAALEEACRCTGTIAERFQAAEREAGALFVGGEEENIVSAPAIDTSNGNAQYVFASYTEPYQGAGLYQEGDGDDPATARERSGVYTHWTNELESANTMRSDIEFYNAAARVTALLGIADDQANLLNMYDLNLEIFVGVPALNNFIGKGLFRLNNGIFELLRDGKLELPNGQMVSPMNDPSIFEWLRQGYTVDSDGQLLDSQGNATGRFVNVVNTPLDWDIAMVWREQLEVHSLLDQYANQMATNNRFGEYLRALNGVNILLNVGDDWIARGGSQSIFGASSENFQAIDWAERALRNANVLEPARDITFGNLDHRAAIGMAMVFQQHASALGGVEQAQAAYEAYIQNMVNLTNQTTPWGTNILYGSTIPEVGSIPEIPYHYIPRTPVPNSAFPNQQMKI